MTIFGWDGSDFDLGRGPVDVEQMVADLGAPDCFVTFKATEGTRFQHAHYGDVINRARRAGVKILGAYVVPRTPANNGNGSIAEQAAYFLAYLDAQTPWWRTYPGFMLQVDTEHWGNYDTVDPRYGVEMCDRLAATGKLRIHYAPKWAYEDSIGGNDPLWSSNYVTGAGHFRALYPGDGSGRWVGYSGRTPTILQYSSTARIGNQPGCDANAFRGTFDQLWTLITGDDMPLTDDDAFKVALAVWRTGLGGVIGPNEDRKTAEFWLMEGHDSAAAAASAKPAVAPVALSDADRAAIVADLAALLPKPPTAGEVAEELAKRLGNG